MRRGLTRLKSEPYRAFLKSDFPHIPFTDNKAAFEKLSAIGQNLIGIHLLKSLPNTPEIAYCGEGAHQVKKLRYAAAQQRLYINDTQYFSPLAQEVWEFHIGGYQVLAQYLKSRKNRALTLNEINNIKNTAQALKATIDAMNDIDKILKL